MPYEILERDGKHCVAKAGGEVLKCYGSKEQATSYLRALYANVEDATTASGDPDHRPVGKGNQTSVSGQLAAAAVSAPVFNSRWKEAQKAAGQHQPALEKKYLAAFLAQAKRSQEMYMGQGLTSAAVEPTGDVSPDIPGGIINEKQFKESVDARTAAQRKRMVNEVAVGILGKPGAKGNAETFGAVLESVAAVQSHNAFLAAEDAVHSAILDGITQGLSVQETANRIGEVMSEWAPWQAQRQAQTDLVALANGSAHASAKVLGEDAPQYKTWLTAGDADVREAHQVMDGVTVGLEEPFIVDGFPLDHPGDPSGPDGLVINCRCTQIYTDSPTPSLDHTDSGGIGETDELARAASAMALVAYSDEQPRDDHGRFGEGSSDEQKPDEDPRNAPVQLTNVAPFNSGTMNTVYRAQDGAMLVAVKPEAELSRDYLRPNIEPGNDLQREQAAFLIAERVKELDPQLSVDVPRYRIGDDPELGKVGVSDWADGVTVGEVAMNGDSLPNFGEMRSEALFDSIVGNQDRNLGNLIVNNGNVTLIDHGLAFPEKFIRGAPEELSGRGVWDEGSPRLNVGEMSLLEKLQENRDEITSQDLAGLPASAQDAFWERIQTMQESGVRV